MSNTEPAAEAPQDLNFTVRLPETLVSEIQAWAAAEDRSRNNMIKTLLTEACNARQTRLAADDHREPLPKRRNWSDKKIATELGMDPDEATAPQTRRAVPGA